jgi:hypothetical protein
LLENALKHDYRAAHHPGTQEYFTLQDLKTMLKELQACNVLQRVKKRIIEILGAPSLST